MGKSGQELLGGLPVAVLLLSLLLSSCTLPRIVVLEDTLTAEQHNDLGYVYEQKGILDLAEKEYLLAARKREEWHVPYFNLGNLAFQREDYGKAEEFFRKALRYAPEQTDLLNNLANALLMQDRLAEARLLIEKALLADRKEAYLDTLKEIQKREALSPAGPGKNR
jgi:Flp pilus assembly protein TadD